MAVFAMLDEITQPMFSRSAEPLDWVYDCIGIVIGIAIVAITSWAWERGSR
jgi:VanZ family protein